MRQPAHACAPSSAQQPTLQRLLGHDGRGLQVARHVVAGRRGLLLLPLVPSGLAEALIQLMLLLMLLLLLLLSHHLLQLRLRCHRRLRVHGGAARAP